MAIIASLFQYTPQQRGDFVRSNFRQANPGFNTRLRIRRRHKAGNPRRKKEKGFNTRLRIRRRHHRLPSASSTMMFQYTPPHKEATVPHKNAWPIDDTQQFPPTCLVSPSFIPSCQRAIFTSSSPPSSYTKCEPRFRFVLCNLMSRNHL